jgi:hypothetical protein
MATWRVGRKLGRTLYKDDQCVGMVDTLELAAEIVGTMTSPPEPVFDVGGPALRPHTIPGWWQVWSGHICIALLRPEDVAPVLVAGREALAQAVGVEKTKRRT